MRGRTNASNGGIFLNATTDDFEVATGNTIVAGDFVEYKYNTEIQPLNAVFAGESYLVDASTHTYIALIGNFPTLFTYIDGEISVIHSYNTTSTCLIRLDATHYVIWNSTTSKIYLISCTTTEISLVTESTSSYSNSNSFVRVNETTVVFKQSSSNYLYKATVDVNYTNISVTDANIGLTFTIAGATSDKVILLNKTNSGSTYTNNFLRYNVSNLTQIDTFSIATYNTGLTPVSNMVFNDRYILGYYLSKVGSSPYYNYENLVIIDTIEKKTVCSEVVQNDHTTSNNSLAISQSNNSNEFIVSEEYYKSYQNYEVWNYVFTFNANLGTLTKSENTIINDRLSYIFYKFNEKEYGGMISNEGYRNFDITTGKVVVGTPTNTVEEWQGSGNPIGVAKQSGNAGDTIAVYIPQVNS